MQRSGWLVACGTIIGATVIGCILIAGAFYWIGSNATAVTRIPSATPDYRRLDIRDIVEDPELFDGRPMFLVGTVFGIKEIGSYSTLQVWVDRPGSSIPESITVTYDKPLPDIRSHPRIEIRGRGNGSRNSTGDVRPLIKADSIILQP